MNIIDQKRSSQRGMHLGQKGQIAVEYILLLSIAVFLSAIITKTVVSRNPESTGFLISKWYQIIETLGADYADDVEPIN